MSWCSHIGAVVWVVCGVCTDLCVAVCVGLCPDWEDWNPKDGVKNAKEAMDAAQQWLDVPQVTTRAGQTGALWWDIMRCKTRCCYYGRETGLLMWRGHLGS